MSIKNEQGEQVIVVRIINLEQWVTKIDNRLWTMISLLIVNLAGLIGILIANIK